MYMQRFEDIYINFLTTSWSYGGILTDKPTATKEGRKQKKLRIEEYDGNHAAAKESFRQMIQCYEYPISANDIESKEKNRIVRLPRRYHTLQSHVMEMLEFLGLNREDFGLTNHEYMNLFLAIAWHDSRYDTFKNRAIKGEDPDRTNEVRSACAFHQSIGIKLWNNIESTRLDVVGDLIHATDPLLPMTSNLQEGVIRDLDLMGLGSSPQQFDFNSQLIRMEYANFSDKEYYTGRIAFFEMILERVSIFHTQHMYTKFEDQARENIERELAVIRKLVK